MQKSKTIFSPTRARDSHSSIRPSMYAKRSPTTPPMDEEIEAYQTVVNHTLQDKEENRSNLEELTKKGERELLRIKTIFPFTLFPDEVIIDENKTTIVTRQFFLTKNIRSILHKDIANINVQTSFLFATLSITDQYFSRDPINVHFLTKSDAIHARQTIQGLMVANQKNVNVSQIRIEDAREKLIQIGQVDQELQG